VARQSGVAESLLDEVRLAVGEACSRAVEAHQRYCPAEPVRIALTEQSGRFEIQVTDVRPVAAVAPQAAAADQQADDDFGNPNGFALAVIAGLADAVQVSETASGTSITMSWPAQARHSDLR
jgi:anti-sigma regulatory factor (Ser/Thr protein kinase)